MNTWTKNLKQAIKNNGSLPIPKYPITASYEFLNISIPNGFKINPVDAKELGHNEYVEQNGKRIYWGIDGTYYAMNESFDGPVIGDGQALESIPNHISNPWTRYWWVVPMYKEKDLHQKEGWCMTTHRKRLEKDIMVDVLHKKHLDLFDVANDFVYDGIDPKYKDLIDKMCRKINPKRYSKFSYSRFGLQTNLIGTAFAPGPWHSTRLIELIPETRMNFFYVTEKTVKAIATGMPFVMIGCQHFMRLMRHIGFKTFHPYIDESYDREPDLARRIEMAVDSFASFVRNPNNLNDIQKICDHNIDILVKLRKHDYYSYIWKKVRRFIEL
tara:strand:- start:119 stop:1099 length:981 start_codon:yes stop_codon:yes gene_type:complete